jgi:hypothetical protein
MPVKKEPLMRSSVLQTIEAQLPLLSHDEQLWLIEHLAKLQKEKRREKWAASLEAMANDPQIQAEIRYIQEEFATTEADGLEGL